MLGGDYVMRTYATTLQRLRCCHVTMQEVLQMLSWAFAPGLADAVRSDNGIEFCNHIV